MRARSTLRTAALACGMLFTLLVGCGESEQAKAEKSVCEAKTKIAASVQSLQSETVQTVTLTGVESNLSTITENLGKIRQAQSKLSGTRKEQVQKANEAFAAELSALTREFTNLSATQVKAQLTSSIEKLATSYRQVLAPVKC
jgi:ABC-type transporter MlaC component